MVASSLRFLITASLLTASAVSAQPLSVAVGETKVITLSQRVAGVEVENGSVVEVTRMRRGTAVVVTGKLLGKTELTLHTYGGNDVTLTFNVTSSGSRAFSADRRGGQMTISTPEIESQEPAPAPSAQAAPATDATAIATVE